MLNLILALFFGGNTWNIFASSLFEIRSRDRRRHQRDDDARKKADKHLPSDRGGYCSGAPEHYSNEDQSL